MAITVPSGELFFTKTNKKRLSWPHIHVQIENNTYKCLDATAGEDGGVGDGGWGGVLQHSNRKGHFLLFVSPPLLSTSRVGHGMEAGQRWERRNLSPVGSLVSRKVGGQGGSGAGQRCRWGAGASE